MKFFPRSPAIYINLNESKFQMSSFRREVFIPRKPIPKDMAKKIHWKNSYRMPSVKGYCMYKMIVKNAETWQRLDIHIYEKKFSRTYRNIAETFCRSFGNACYENGAALIVVEASAKLIKPTGEERP